MERLKKRRQKKSKTQKYTSYRTLFIDKNHFLLLNLLPICVLLRAQIDRANFQLYNLELCIIWKTMLFYFEQI